MSKKLSYYLENPERVTELSDEQLTAWIAQYPSVQSFRWLKARRDLDLNLPSMRDSIRTAAAHSDDLVLLKYQLLCDKGKMTALRSEAEQWLLEREKAAEARQTTPAADGIVKEIPALEEASAKVDARSSSHEGGDLIDMEGFPTPLSKAAKAKQVEDILREYQEELSEFSAWLMGQKEDQKKSKKKKKKKDKGIKKKSKKKKKSKLEKLISHSIAEREEAITETYADLIASQGHVDKAVELYKKLQLKFPEKSSYFARKIEELNK